MNIEKIESITCEHERALLECYVISDFEGAYDSETYISSYQGMSIVCSHGLLKSNYKFNRTESGFFNEYTDAQLLDLAKEVHNLTKQEILASVTELMAS